MSPTPSDSGSGSGSSGGDDDDDDASSGGGGTEGGTGSGDGGSTGGGSSGGDTGGSTGGDSGGDSGGGDSGSGTGGVTEDGGTWGDGPGAGCFVAGTAILMGGGSRKPIEAVVLGDVVMAFDGVGELEPSTVIDVFVHHGHEVLDIDGVKTTREHPFLGADGEFKAAGLLKPGDVIIREDGAHHMIAAISAVPGRHTVYNFTVERLHTYVAGGFRVHNAKVDPIIFDLDGDGFAFTGTDSPNAVMFDIVGDGFMHAVSWMEAGDGVLAYDANLDGVVNDGTEISFTQYVDGAQTDLEGLVAFDSNGDGMLTSADAEWSKFGVWQDINQDGVTDDGEFLSLDDMGITSIVLSSDGVERDLGNGAMSHGTGTFTNADGQAGSFADASLEISASSVRLADGGATIRAENVPDAYLVIDTTGVTVSFSHGTKATGADAADAFSGAGASESMYFYGFGGDDVLTGGSANDLLEGGDGNDTISGNAGHDLIVGGAGADTLDGGAGVDTVSYKDSAAGVSVDLATNTVSGGSAEGDQISGFENAVGSEFADTLAGDGGANALQGLDGDDELRGEGGDDILSGGQGNDTLLGGGGNDTYVIAFGDAGAVIYDYDIETTVTEERYLAGYDGATAVYGTRTTTTRALVDGGSDDVIRFAGTVTADEVSARARGDDLIVTLHDDFDGDGTETANAVAVAQNGLLANHRIERLTFADGTSIALAAALLGTEAAEAMAGTVGDDTILSGAGDDTITGGDGNDDILAGTGNDIIDGGVGNDRIWAGFGDDTLDGGAGDDLLSGGGGNDWFVGGAGADTLDGGDGVDTVDYSASAAAITVDLAAGTGAGGDAGGDTLSDVENVIGTAFDDTLTGSDAANTLDGGAGNDVLNGGAGDDVLIGGSGADTLDGGAGVDMASYETAASGVRVHTGDMASNTGDAAGDTYTGIEGVRGSAHDDELIMVEDNAILDGGAGDDLLTAKGVDVEIHGGDGNDSLWADCGDDLLDGGAGDDSVFGYEGNDTLLLGAGNDYAKAGDGNDVIDGGAGIDEIDAGAGDDVLIGGAGADTLDGGWGFDIASYETAAAGVLIDTRDLSLSTGDAEGDCYVDIEALRGSAHADTFIAHLDWAVLFGGAGDDALTLLGWGGDLHGDEGNDTLTAAGGDNLLDGGAGADTMAGGDGDDTYRVDDAGDVIVEAAGAGDDLVEATVSYTLADNVERLTLTGTDAIDGTGNALDNVLIGNSAANVLDGGAGADQMSGGAGDDTYVVDDAGDVVCENADEGVDTVVSSLDYALGANVENLTLAGGALNGTGNDLDNLIVGNACENALSGGVGADRLEGGAGDDILAGGAGNDTYNYYRGDGDDIIIDGASDGNGDVLKVHGVNGITQTCFHAQGHDLLIEIYETSSGAGDGGSILIKDYLNMAGDYGVETIIDGDNNVWTKSDVFQQLYGNSQGGLDMWGTWDDDTFVGTAQADSYHGGDGNDLLIGGGGNDDLIAEGGCDVVEGGDGDDWLVGGDGDDWLTGGAGDDTFVYNRGDGHDVIVDGASDGDADTLRVEGVNGYTQTVITASGKDLLIQIDPSTPGGSDGGSVLVKDFLNMSGDYGVETLVDGDGNAWSKADIFQLLYGNSEGGLTIWGTWEHEVFVGTAQNDVFHSGDGDDVLVGNGGNDTLVGDDGDDTIDGGAGDDWLVGGNGNDTFVFAPGSGEDGIGDFEAHGGSADGDVIELHGQSVSTFEALMANAEEWGGNSWLHLDDGGLIIVHDVGLSQLSADDFRFAA
ncbi:polymorphic toxin-type HINT domain-containing protein [Pelagibacterium halotolerans]|uniref:polymorphic toxin-type HINT domain-containing protein n=1 Tax=Pelagibacterium halotolerans TaxID=531813 RepID=UPI00384CD869